MANYKNGVCQNFITTVLTGGISICFMQTMKKVQLVDFFEIKKNNFQH